jgi:hypothetical protein
VVRIEPVELTAQEQRLVEGPVLAGGAFLILSNGATRHRSRARHDFSQTPLTIVSVTNLTVPEMPM